MRRSSKGRSWKYVSCVRPQLALRIQLHDSSDSDPDAVRNEILLTAPLYRKRAGLISQIPNFWSLVLEQAPQDIDQFIQPTDSHILLSCLKTIDVARFEVPPYAAEGATDGSPRSIAIRFTFKPNEWFEDEVLEKKFWYRRRRGHSAWAGLVSEPVRVRWKSKAQDPTGGLTDAAYALWQAEKRAQAEGAKKGEGRAEEKKGKGPNKKSKDLLPEHRELDKRSHASGQGAISFFTWFGYRGPNVTAEESAAAMQEERERRDKVKGGENPPPPEDGSIDDGDAEDGDDDGDHDELLWEVYPGGEELAISISEDLYPSALKYFSEWQSERTIPSARNDSAPFSHPISPLPFQWPSTNHIPFSAQSQHKKKTGPRTTTLKTAATRTAYVATTTTMRRTTRRRTKSKAPRRPCSIYESSSTSRGRALPTTRRRRRSTDG